MKNQLRTLLPVLLMLSLFLSGCNLPLTVLSQPGSGGSQGGASQVPLPINHVTPTASATSQLPDGIWLSPSLPSTLVSAISPLTIEKVDQPEKAGLLLASTDEAGNDVKLVQESTWIYALTGPFYEIRDGVSSDELKKIWYAQAEGDLAEIRLVMEGSTLAAFTLRWGAPSPATVTVKSADELLTDTWSEKNTWAIIPFEEIVPKYKVLKIDGISPLDKPMDLQHYPLLVKFGLFQVSGASIDAQPAASMLLTGLPVTNRDESKMTVLIMSGTTALTRATAYMIDIKGADHVISGVKDWFLSADLRHVSNEVSFDPDCPKPDPNSTSMRFCSNPSYIELLKGLGINVVELTGNHENDYGADKFAQTVQLYQQLGWTIFGGGLTPEDARKPALVENNGNKIAFIGCNPVGPANAWVNDTRAGVAKCDPDYYYGQIKQLKQEGYVVVATFQHQEIYQYMYDDAYKVDFRQAADSGADIVDGSQAHFPMGFEFRDNAFIHYGMGNFMFDQMDYPVVGTRREFVDRHVIYDGKYINTELLTALLTEYSRPVPMTQDQRTQFLSDLFTASGW